MRRGVEAGRGPDRDVVRIFVDRILPGAAKAVLALSAATLDRELGSAVEDASDAYRVFARFVEDVVVPAAIVEKRLGGEEVAFRLRTMGVEDEPSTVLARARHELARAGDAMIEEARRLGSTVARLDDVRIVVQSIFTARPATIADALAAYRDQLAAATQFVRERGIVEVPEGIALGLEPLPSGISDGAALTNWPAPLFDRRGAGHVLYAPDIAAHASVAIKNLAVHEGIPGHYLQSLVWQRMFVGDHDFDRAGPSGCRWIGVADDIAMSRQYFGTMLSVEGWAVHMEQQLRAHGFYEDGAEKLFFAVCDAIRAVRVVLDLELHAGEMNAEQAVRLVEQTTAMPESWARGQVLRSRRVPLQGLTYLCGSLDIASLQRAKVPASQRGLDARAFHRALLSFGPVPASRLSRLSRLPDAFATEIDAPTT